MTEHRNPQNPTDPPDTERRLDADPEPSSPRLRFISSRPPETGDGRTLVSDLRAFANCEHPSHGHSPTVDIFSEGIRTAFTWCGACGAVRFVDDDVGDWIRPGFLELLREENMVAVLATGVDTFIDGLVRIMIEIRSLNALAIPGGDRTRLLSALQSLANLCDETERATSVARRQLGI